MSLANAYATLAARGVRCEPIIISSAHRKNGEPIEVPSANCQRVISTDVADTVNNVLKTPFRGGTASPAYIPGYDLAGKTGTETKAPSVFLMGYTPSVVGAAMITVDKVHPLQEHPPRPSQPGGRAAGQRPCALRIIGPGGRTLIWKPAMQKILPLVPKKSFPRAPSAPVRCHHPDQVVSAPRRRTAGPAQHGWFQHPDRQQVGQGAKEPCSAPRRGVALPSTRW